jgi:glyoxylase-like metal-dependent hydrolase (beta-lactamase superfamily II)
VSDVLAIPLGDNTVYLVETGGARVLIDTGPDFRGAAESLERALAGRLPDVVVATHGHVDHAGLGAWWQERGVPVALHRADWPLATGAAPSDSEFDALKQFALESGAPPEVAAEAIEAIEQRRRWAGASRAAGDYRPVGRDRRWPSGLRYLPFAPRLDVTDVGVPGLELVHLPGHTPGNVVAWVPAEGWLFSGDQLLPGITPTPALQGHHLPGSQDWRFRSLPHFLTSLRRLRALAPARCFPGHGEPFGEIVTVIDVNLAQAEQRVERTLAILREGGPATLYAVAEGLYPRAVRRRFWQIVATAQGLLDELEARGEAVFEDGRWAATQATSASRS